MVQAADFDPAVPLPAGLDISAIRRAIEYIEKELADVYKRKHIIVKGGKPVPVNGD